MNKKRYIILLVIMALLFITLFMIYGINYFKKDNKSAILIIGNTSIMKYQNNIWTNINKSEINWKEFVLYDENIKQGTFQVWKDDSKCHYYDKEKTEKRINGKTLAYNANYKITIDKYKEQNLNYNDNNINYVLKDNDISSDTNFNSRYKIVIDYDHDNIKEEFYVISNAFIKNNINKLFSIAFMVKDKKLYYLYNSIDEQKSISDGCLPYYNYFLNIIEDKIDEIILSCAKYSNLPTNDMLYKFDNEKNEFVIENSN